MTCFVQILDHLICVSIVYFDFDSCWLLNLVFFVAALLHADGTECVPAADRPLNSINGAFFGGQRIRLLKLVNQLVLRDVDVLAW